MMTDGAIGKFVVRIVTARWRGNTTFSTNNFKKDGVNSHHAVNWPKDVDGMREREGLLN
jgi:hypothetical protein